MYDSILWRFSACVLFSRQPNGAASQPPNQYKKMRNALHLLHALPYLAFTLTIVYVACSFSVWEAATCAVLGAWIPRALHASVEDAMEEYTS